MNVIKTGHSAYEEYEQLLLERDRLRKEAGQIWICYMKQFGQLISDVFEQKIACIRRKKKIACYQQHINRGEKIDPQAVEAFLAREMAAYEQELARLIADAKRCRDARACSAYEVKRSKELYRRIAKLIHPDINPETDTHPELGELWNRTQIAYHANNVKELVEIEVLVRKALKELGLGRAQAEIPDIDDRIGELRAEIELIRRTEPYTYKYLLEDEAAVGEKEQALRDELASYESYIKELDEAINALILEGGVKFSWQMS